MRPRRTEQPPATRELSAGAANRLLMLTLCQMASTVVWRGVETFTVVEAFGNRYAFQRVHGTLFPLPFKDGLLSYALRFDGDALIDRKGAIVGGVEDLTFVMAKRTKPC